MHGIFSNRIVVRLTVCAAALAVADIAGASVSMSESGSLRKAAQIKPPKSGGIHTAATGSIGLIDSGGLKYFINTNITFSTSSSASAAMSEASYQGPVNADTLNGGVAASTLNDAFDGYNAVCTSLSATGPCATGNAAYTLYLKNGPATGSCSEGGVNRLYTFPARFAAGGAVTLQRSVYVPSNDQFARWLNVFTNTSGAPVTLNMITSNNLGSDSNTVITASSSGTAGPSITTPRTWIASFQNWSGTTSSDPRLGHVFSGLGGQGVSTMFFADGNDKPFWSYSITLAPGQTKTIASFVTGQPTRVAAAQKAAAIASGNLGGNLGACMTSTEKSRVSNFAAAAPATEAIPVFSLPVLAGLSALLGLFGFGFVFNRRNRT